MARIVLTFGLISGLIIIGMFFITLPLVESGKLDFEKTEVIGYSTMVLSFLLVFFGIRTYREKVAGGCITFGRAFKVGILITLVASTVYVVAWEIYYFNFAPDFVEKYVEMTIAKMKERGATEAAITAEREKMARFMELYQNPFVNVAMTLMEIFPVGLVMTLVSAGILRKRQSDDVSGATTAAIA